MDEQRVRRIVREELTKAVSVGRDGIAYTPRCDARALLMSRKMLWRGDRDRCGKTNAQIAAELSHITAKHYTVEHVNRWLSDARDDCDMPGSIGPFWAAVTSSKASIDVTIGSTLPEESKLCAV